MTAAIKIAEQLLLSTKPCDREVTETALRACYRRADLAEPRYIGWVESPMTLILGGLVAAHQLETGYQRKRPTEIVPGGEQITRLALAAADGVVDALKPARRDVPAYVRGKLYADTLHRRLFGPVFRELGCPRIPSLHTKHWANWADRVIVEAIQSRPETIYSHTLDAFRASLLGPENIPEVAVMADRELPPDLSAKRFAIESLVTSMGWCFPHEDFAIICDRPLRITADQVVFRDGWTVGFSSPNR